MNDFVSLSCPSCGGKFSIGVNQFTYTCQYCGQSHKLRKEDIEYFGRYPKCHRNYRVEKLSAIVLKQEHFSKRFRPPTNLNSVKFYRLEDSTKIQKDVSWLKVDERQESIYTRKGKLFGWGSLASFILSFVLLTVVPPIGAVLFLVSIALFVVSCVNRFKGKKDFSDYHKQLILTKNIQTQIVRDRYDKIYYCHRDDLLFIPGEDDFTSGSNYENFLVQVIT